MKRRIFVFNNDNDFLDLMNEVLGEEGFEVAIHKTWEDAHKIVRDALPDLVIVDLMFDRELHGFQMIDLLMLDPITRPIPVIVCSAATKELAEHAAALQTLGVAMVPKPFDLTQLLTAVRGQLARNTQTT